MGKPSFEFVPTSIENITRASRKDSRYTARTSSAVEIHGHRKEDKLLLKSRGPSSLVLDFHRPDGRFFLSIEANLRSIAVMTTRYVINLSDDERAGLEHLLSRKRLSKLKAQRIRILLIGPTRA